MPLGRVQRPKGKSSAFQRLQDQLKWVDLIFEVRDARVPESSRHPKSEQIFGNKPRIIVLCKEDLADPQVASGWLDALAGDDQKQVLALSIKHTRGKDKLVELALACTKAKREALQKRGLLPRPMRACVVGMPNVGKSSLINWLIGRRKALVGNKPGVTKGPQWVRLHPQLELLDTPGILPPVAFGKDVKLKLSMLNLLPDNLYDHEEVAEEGIAMMAEVYPRILGTYGIDAQSDNSGLEQLATTRNCLGAGGSLDVRRAASIFLNDLRDGKIGRLTLDALPERR